jgi:hypothetical protein
MPASRELQLGTVMISIARGFSRTKWCREERTRERESMVAGIATACH